MWFSLYLVTFVSILSFCTSKDNQCCDENEVFVNCKVECPDRHCPTNDNRGIIACDPPYPCPSGCVCGFRYRRKSFTDPECIEPQHCAPVNCTRPNEEWASCPSPCLAEGCADVNNQPTTCNTLIEPVCYPQCVCKSNHFRNDDDICVPVEDCPKTN